VALCVCALMLRQLTCCAPTAAASVTCSRQSPWPLLQQEGAVTLLPAWASWCAMTAAAVACRVQPGPRQQHRVGTPAGEGGLQQLPGCQVAVPCPDGAAKQ
jgi:hypothetical protein